MEKRKEKSDLEQLLKRLLELWRKPNWKEYNHVHAEANRIMSDFWTFYRFCNYVENGSINRCLNLKLREIVSVNSGLWQFCVENKFVKEDDGHITRIINLYKSDESIVDGWWDYHYWLMICSILDESELENFLLENIKL